MAFGGMAGNVFNPALVGRCFLYICFPLAMTAAWAAPAGGGALPGGLAAWGVDAVTAPTPLDAYRAGGEVSLGRLFLGNVGGCLGETCAPAILLGAAYLLFRKVANWRITAGCLAGAVVAAAVLNAVDPARVGGPLFQVLAGGFLFGAVFMATDPVSAARTDPGRWVYGVLIGALTVVLRGYSNFSCGLMFAILIGNMFAPLIDAGVKARQARRKAAREAGRA
jgi:Na+-transporting NADH:ubiquinone oxidoreductase subunit B